MWKSNQLLQKGEQDSCYPGNARRWFHQVIDEYCGMINHGSAQDHRRLVPSLVLPYMDFCECMLGWISHLMVGWEGIFEEHAVMMIACRGHF